MTEGRARRAWIGILFVVVVALVAWRLWPRDVERPTAPPPPVPTTTQPAADAPKPRDPRRRDAAKSDVPAELPAAPSPVAAAKQSPKTEETFPIEVKVLRADGTPAAGATVALVDPEPDEGKDGVVTRATADEKGVATMRAPDFVVRAAAWLGAEAHATGELLDAKETHAVTLRLTPAMVVRGRVLRGDSPEGDADVELTMCPWFGSDFGLSFRTKSDAAGRFELPPIALAGIDRLNPPSVEATAKDMARGYGAADLEKPEAEIVVLLKPGFTARARFIDVDGKPVAVELWASGARTHIGKTDADGRVALRLPDAQFRFLAFRTTDRAVLSGFDDGNPIVANWRTVRSIGARDDGIAGDVELGDIVMKRGRPVVGHVVDSAGKAMAKAMATLSLDDVGVGSVVADKSGRFEFPEVGDEPHRVYVRETLPDSSADVPRTTQIEGVRGGDPDLRVVLPSATERLTVTLRFFSEGDRKPVSSREIRVKAWRHGEERSCVDTQCMGDPMDTFGILVPEPGSFDVEVVVGGFEPQRFEAVEVAVGRPRTFDVLLRKKHE